MGVGHLAVGLAVKRADTRVNVGGWIFAAFLCDFLLGLFAWAGLESAGGFAEYPVRRFLTFDFPYSHGLAGTLLWSTMAAALVGIVTKSKRLAIIAAAVVFSHFLLDAVSHLPELPLAGRRSPKVGLGLWNHLAWELLLEVLMVAAALAIYLRSIAGRVRGMIAFALVLTATMVGGQALGSAPPDSRTLVASWLAAPVAIAGIASWLDRR